MTEAATATAWAGPDSEIGQELELVSSQTLAAYREAPRLVEEHHNLELAAVEGGYGRRQLFELIQNGADELLHGSGRIEVVLTEDALYCANQGRPLSVEGIRALLYSHLSAKKGTEIGRFGLGFKSVLGITKAPEIFSRTGSVRFDPAHTREAIAHALGQSVDKVPTLRVGVPLEPDEERQADPVLGELMSWASTVVRLGRDTEESSWLEHDIRDFPPQFLLFSPHVEELVLEDREAEDRRVVISRSEGDERVLIDRSVETTWRVFSTVHEPSAKARDDAGRHADRDEIPLAWAVPTRRGRRGEFWAFFPTLDQTTLSGVINAPWKLNEDRTRIIEGPFNQELLETAAQLVLEHIEHLVGADDPGVVLDLMPARGREAAGWADGVLTDRINDGAGYHASIPDQAGELEVPMRINLHPAGIPREVLELWSAGPHRPANWCHSSVETRERRPRVELYLGPSGRQAETVAKWLQALLGPNKEASSTHAIRVAARLLGHDYDEFISEVRGARIVLDDEGQLRSLELDDLYVRAPLPVDVEVAYVHPGVAASEGMIDALAVLGIQEIHPFLVLSSLVKEPRRGWGPPAWDRFWDLVRRSDQMNVVKLFGEAQINPRLLMVRTAAGDYARLTGVLLPGAILPKHTVEDRGSLLDTAFHERELRLLQAVGATPAPVTDGGSRAEPWFAIYKKQAQVEYLDKLRKSGASPNTQYLDFRAQKFAGPLAPLDTLSDAAKARYTIAVLSAADDLRPWVFHHTTQPRYPEMAWPNPVVWIVRQYGILETTLGVSEIRDAVGPTLRDYDDVFPVASISAAAAEALELPTTLADLSELHWEAALEQVLELERDQAIGATYLAAATHGVDAPPLLRARVGKALDERAAETIAVTADEELARVFSQTSQPFIRVPSDADAQTMVREWDLRHGTDAVRTEVRWVAGGQPEPLIDAYPMLRLSLGPEQRSLQLQPCTELKLETFTDNGRISADKDVALDGDNILRLADLDDRAFLADLSAALSLGLDDAQIEVTIKNLAQKRVQKLRVEIRDAETDGHRLLLAMGVDELRRGLPRTLIEAVERLHGELNDLDVAGLALVVHGVRVLQEHSDVLEDRGLGPPSRWAGSRRAVEFVRDLGFGPEHAGFESTRPSATLLVEGRPELGPLHDYQATIVADMRSLLRGENGLRGLLSLPTGAGKTRVTIEALVDAITDRELETPILWVAQTGELCEQAVQTWSEIWRAFGPTEPLTISRLWSSDEAEQVERGNQVVVATIQKLDAGLYDKPRYKWLSRATCIVVDEAHSSIGPSYTRLLEWQGMGRGKDRAPLVGLTATPFKGTSEEETRRLVARYGGARLDLEALGGVDAYPHLQGMGILSHVDHELLPGSELDLSADELKKLQHTRMLPPAAGRSLGADVERNRTLLESLISLDESWPVLLFAASVEHAQTMAALLVREGVSAASISAETDPSARRHYIEQFRSGKIRVLTNFNVLTAGFDAPKTRAVYVARPTYSPNAYQQMVGRGLRGPLNGGTDRCLLVNVEDNVLRYKEQLAFHEFDYLWSHSSAVTT